MVLNGVDESKLGVLTTTEKQMARLRFGISTEKKVITLHSRICPVKAQKEVAEAVAMMNEEDKRRFVVLCSGEQTGSYYQELVSFIKTRRIEQNFVFCGWLDARTVIGSADLMLLPSTVEGFGLNCIEAMFLKVPVARTRMGGYLDMAKYVYAIDEPSPECIKRCILDFLDNEKAFDTKVQPAYDFVTSYCTVTAMAKNTIEVYKSTIKNMMNKN